MCLLFFAQLMHSSISFSIHSKQTGLIQFVSALLAFIVWNYFLITSPSFPFTSEPELKLNQ